MAEWPSATGTPGRRARSPGPSGRRRSEDRTLYVRVMAEELVRRSRASRVGTRSHYTDAELWVSPEDYARRDGADP